jgi:hypothetical protein
MYFSFESLSLEPHILVHWESFRGPKKEVKWIN